MKTITPIVGGGFDDELAAFESSNCGGFLFIRLFRIGNL
jgi:hypothetical protein